MLNSFKLVFIVTLALHNHAGPYVRQFSSKPKKSVSAPSPQRSRRDMRAKSSPLNKPKGSRDSSVPPVKMEDEEGFPIHSDLEVVRENDVLLVLGHSGMLPSALFFLWITIARFLALVT